MASKLYGSVSFCGAPVVCKEFVWTLDRSGNLKLEDKQELEVHIKTDRSVDATFGTCREKKIYMYCLISIWVGSGRS